MILWILLFPLDVLKASAQRGHLTPPSTCCASLSSPAARGRHSQRPAQVGGTTRRVSLSSERRGGWWRRRWGGRFVLPAPHSELTPMLGALWTETGRSSAVPPHLAAGAAGEIRGTVMLPRSARRSGCGASAMLRKLSGCGVLEANVSPDRAAN